MRRQPARSAPPRLVEEMRGGGSCRPEEKPGGDARGAGVLIKIIKVLIKKTVPKQCAKRTPAQHRTALLSQESARGSAC